MKLNKEETNLSISNKVEKFNQWQGEQLLGVYNPGNKEMDPAF
jgi:hypothetical protein